MKIPAGQGLAFDPPRAPVDRVREDRRRGRIQRAKLSDEEWDLFLWKVNGHSSREIAQYQGRSVSAVDTLFSRTKQKLRTMLG